VVDDADTVRQLISTVLTTEGYEVDTAGSVSEAAALGPAGYDAVLVDVHLGAESGADFVRGLRVLDPDIARRCLFLSGGAFDDLPGDVATLAKPFRLEGLLDAVQHLVTAPPPDRQGRVSKELTWVAALRAGAAADSRAGAFLLTLAGALRERERQHLADFLHDGPIQELTSMLLGMGLVRRSLSAGTPERLSTVDDRLASLEDQLSATMATLRTELGGWRAHVHSPDSFQATLRQRVPGLLADELVLADRPGLSPSEVMTVVAVVELLLLGLDIQEPVAEATVEARREGADVALSLRARRRPRMVPPAEDQLRRARIDRLAGLLGATVRADDAGLEWTVDVLLRAADIKITQVVDRG
jgi:CheY-like chemotaxis protein